VPAAAGLVIAAKALAAAPVPGLPHRLYEAAMGNTRRG
jgi:hypothetical protein